MAVVDPAKLCNNVVLIIFTWLNITNNENSLSEIETFEGKRHISTHCLGKNCFWALKCLMSWKFIHYNQLDLTRTKNRGRFSFIVLLFDS